MHYSVVIPAAGSGTRMQSDVPKALISFVGRRGGPPKSIIRRTVEAFYNDPSCRRIVVCVPAEWKERFHKELDGLEKVTLICGGDTRQESVRLGVESLGVALRQQGEPETKACVLVHDGARCCISQAVISRVVAAVIEYGAVTAAVPVPDTLNKVQDGIVASQVDRDSVWAIQTPQGFFLEELRSAHTAADSDGFRASDDASVMARQRPVRVVAGDRFNIKVTHPEDLRVVAQILE